MFFRVESSQGTPLRDVDMVKITRYCKYNSDI